MPTSGEIASATDVSDESITTSGYKVMRISLTGANGEYRRNYKLFTRSQRR